MGEGQQLDGDDIQTEQGQEQRADKEAVFPGLKVGEAWAESITKQRAGELEARLQQWEAEGQAHGKQRSPFDGETLTGADVRWLVARKGLWRIPELDDSVQVDFMEAAAKLRSIDDGESSKKPFMLYLQLAGANLSEAHLEGACLNAARLKEVNLFKANLAGADLSWAYLEGADLRHVNLTGANLELAHLAGVALDGAMLDSATNLSRVSLTDESGCLSLLFRLLHVDPTYGAVSVCDTHWNDVDLTKVDWSRVHKLGDEPNAASRFWWRIQGHATTAAARRRRFADHDARERNWLYRLSYRYGYIQSAVEEATRANVQLAKHLRDAGMNYDADRFAYRAQVCQRRAHLLQLRLGRWLFSWLLFILAGYGYRPLRTLFWYLAVIGSFAFAFYMATRGAITFGLHQSTFQPLAWYEALVLSVSSFHGRGFLPFSNLGDPVTILAAIEAVFGLFIEVSFIATFTQRYFGK